MYEVYADSLLMYSDKIENLKIFNPKVELELNKTGSFNCTVWQTHPYYSYLQKLKTIVKVYQDDYLLFKGRILNDELGFHNEKFIECEGCLAFLIDSIVRPYEHTGSIEDFLQFLIDNHNSQVDDDKKFVLGNVTVTDPNDYIVRSSIDCANTWDVINDKLIKLLGGYITVRYEDETAYIDYLEDFTLLSPQKVEFAKNLLDMKIIRKGENIKTALIPLGAKIKDTEGNETDERLTIKDVNNGLDYIYDEEAVEKYGWIWDFAIWDDVTVASNLLTKGKAELASLIEPVDTLELSTADLATIDKTVTSFHLGTYINVTSNPHGIEQNFLATKLSIELLNPINNKLSLGGKIESFTEQSWNSINNIPTIKGEKGEPGADGKDGAAGKDGSNGKDAAIQSETAPSDTSYMWLDISLDPPLLKRYNGTEWVIVNDVTETITILEQNMSASIQENADNILASVSESYYLKDDTDALVSAVSTEVSLVKDSMEISFTEYDADLEALKSGTDAEFELIKKYIRFTDGKILLGEIGNELELQIANDRISFLQAGAEVAYFSNRKLYVTDGEYTHSLRLGNFAFVPRDNGNLSFKKIT